LLTVHFPQHGFVIKQIHLGRSTTLEQVNHPFGFGHKMGRVQDASQRIIRLGDCFALVCTAQQRSQRHASQPEAETGQEVATVHLVMIFIQYVHNWVFSLKNIYPLNLASSRLSIVLAITASAAISVASYFWL